MLGLLPSGHLLGALLEVGEDDGVEDEGGSSFSGECFRKVVHALAKRGVALYPEVGFDCFLPRDDAWGFSRLVAECVTYGLSTFVHSVDDEVAQVFGSHLYTDGGVHRDRWVHNQNGVLLTSTESDGVATKVCMCVAS